MLRELWIYQFTCACSSVCAYESKDISACMRMFKYCVHRFMDISVYMYVYVQVFVLIDIWLLQYACECTSICANISMGI